MYAGNPQALQGLGVEGQQGCHFERGLPGVVERWHFGYVCALLFTRFVVTVLGEMETGKVASRKFSQTFFLAEQPQGYFVLNDIFRFLKEDYDVTDYDHESMPEAKEPVAPVVDNAPAPAPVEAKTPKKEVKPAPVAEAPKPEANGSKSLWADEVPTVSAP